MLHHNLLSIAANWGLWPPRDTWPRPCPFSGKVFANFVETAQMLLYTESEISSFTGFEDILGYAKFSKGHVT